MKEFILLAIGGNSLIRAGQTGTVDQQFQNITTTARSAAELVKRGHHLVITHGNGPQVGAGLLRSELAANQVYTHPLDVCVADTQGSMGYMLQNVILKELAHQGIQLPVATIITQVVVDKNDPAFQNPSKPIGPFYSKEVAEQKSRDLGWRMVEDAARGYRRVVASPKPLDIVETSVIARCVKDDIVVIAAGGGGIPVVRTDGGWQGVEAVIDKDRASALLAKKLKADVLMIATDTDRVYLNYKKPNQTALSKMTLAEAKKYYQEGHFPPGNMGPKIESAIEFLENGGKQVLITTPELLVSAIDGKSGTRIIR